MSQVFLSHSHKDKTFAKRLAADLRNNHHDVWVDEAEIRVGDSLIEKIGDALDAVDFVLAVVSTNSVKSEWVKKELEIAMTREISERRAVVLPLLLTKRNLPPFLRVKKYADFTHREQYHKSLLELLRALAQPDPDAERDRPLSGVPVSYRRRINLKSDGLVGVYRRVNTLVHAYKLLPEMSLEREDDRKGWTVGLFDGYISAAMCFLDFLPSVLLPIVDEAGARVVAVSIVMGKHCLEVRATARKPTDESEIELPEVSGFEVTCDEFDGFRAATELNETLLSSCPARDATVYYVGWMKFCADLYALAQSTRMDTRGFIADVVNWIVFCLDTYENVFVKECSTFWFIVFGHVTNTLVGETVFPPFVEEHNDRFISDIDSALQISNEVLDRWRQSAHTVGIGPAVIGALIELRSRFEFTGVLGDEGFEVRVAERL